MSITKWNPWEEMFNLTKRMNRLFEPGLLHRLDLKEDDSITSYLWAPLVDIYETNEDIVVKAEIPGMKKEDIEINITDNVLTIKGEKKQERKMQNEDYHRIECSYGTFQRSFSLPKAIKPDNVTASYKDGVLTITIPKAEEVKPKRIQITTK